MTLLYYYLKIKASKEHEESRNGIPISWILKWWKQQADEQMFLLFFLFM